jgi:hypothetical protein
MHSVIGRIFRVTVLLPISYREPNREHNKDIVTFTPYPSQYVRQSRLLKRRASVMVALCFGASKAVIIVNVVFCAVPSCGFVTGYRRFGGTRYLHLQR